MAEKRFVNKKIGSRPIFCKPDCNHLEFIHFIALYILISIERVAFRFAIKVPFSSAIISLSTTKEVGILWKKKKY